MNKKAIGLIIATSLLSNVYMGTQVSYTATELNNSEVALKATKAELDKTNEHLKSIQSELDSMQNTNAQLNQQIVDLNAKHEAEKRASRGDMDFEYSKVINVQATAYTHTGDATFTGVMPKVGRTIAVDPRVIPLGSKVYVEGIGYRIAEDTGGAIKGNIIDIFMNTENECLKWGRQQLKVYILEGGK